jgi:hypothetical protein
MTRCKAGGLPFFCLPNPACQHRESATTVMSLRTALSYLATRQSHSGAVSTRDAHGGSGLPGASGNIVDTDPVCVLTACHNDITTGKVSYSGAEHVVFCVGHRHGCDLLRLRIEDGGLCESAAAACLHVAIPPVIVIGVERGPGNNLRVRSIKSMFHVKSVMSISECSSIVNMTGCWICLAHCCNNHVVDCGLLSPV